MKNVFRKGDIMYKNKNKFAIIFLLSILVVNLLQVNVSAMNLDRESPLQQYLDELKSIEGEYYLLGKSALKDACTGENKSQIKNDITFYLQNVEDIENKLNQYLKTVEDDRIKSRNVDALVFVANYFKIGLEELLIFLDSDDDTTDYNSLESYFYSKVLASQTISFIQNQIK